MIGYTVLGGMRGTSLVQIVKVAVVFTTMLLLALLVLRNHDFDPGALLSAAEQESGLHDRYFEPGQALDDGAAGRLDFLSLQLSVVLGGACKPHVLMRINSAADAATARRATPYAVAIMAVFFLCVVIAGLGAARVVGGQQIRAVEGSGQMTLLTLAASTVLPACVYGCSGAGTTGPVCCGPCTAVFSAPAPCASAPSPSQAHPPRCCRHTTSTSSGCSRPP